MKLNFEYLKILIEVPLFCVLVVKHVLGALFQKKHPTNAILLVNVSLVGEFAATAPAVHAFIKSNPGCPIDLVVSPPLKPLAMRMRGVRSVYTARSVFSRRTESGEAQIPQEACYENVVVMRISREAFHTLASVRAKKLRTMLPHLVGYGVYLGWCFLMRRTPFSWRELNFKFLQETPAVFPLDAIFAFTPEECAQVAAREELQGSEQKIALHTGASWSMNRWSLAHWVTLLQKLHARGPFRFVFVGTPRDAADFEYIQSHLSFPVFSLIGKTSVVELLLALRACDFCIAVDSGPRNLAQLADVKSITLLGPGPHMYTPPNPRDVVLDRSGGRGWRERFFHKDSDSFIQKITPEDVLSAFGTL